jgi:hypothetical protein
MKLNKIASLGLVISLVSVIIFAIGCKKKSDSTSAAATKSDANQIDTSNLQLVTETEEKERDGFRSNIRALALNGDFQNLESQAEDFRSNKSRFQSGYWKLRAFYLAFGDLPDNASDKDWLELIEKLQQWTRQFPDSITPRLALAEAYRGYAWMARGTDAADKVTTEGYKLMGERLGKSFACLQQAKPLLEKQKDYGFYAITLRVCLGASLERSAYEKIFEMGVQNAPDYSPIYEYKAYYLLPRWYGQQGEWEAFARKMTQRTDIPNSEEIFARCALYLRDLGLFYDEFSADDDSWEDLKSSFHAIEKNYPDSLEIKSILCLISIKLCDYKEGRVQMKLLDGKVDLSVWSSKENFLAAAEWLNRDDASLESARQQFKAQRHQAN